MFIAQSTQGPQIRRLEQTMGTLTGPRGPGVEGRSRRKRRAGLGLCRCHLVVRRGPRAPLAQRPAAEQGAAHDRADGEMPAVHQNAVSYPCASASAVRAWRPITRAAARCAVM